KCRSYWENDGLTVEFRLHAHTFGGRRQCEGESLAEDHGIGPALHLRHHGMKDLGLQHKSSGVGPVASRDRDDLAPLREVIGIDSCEGTRARNARGTGIAKLIAYAGIQSSGTDGRLPL